MVYIFSAIVPLFILITIVAGLKNRSKKHNVFLNVGVVQKNDIPLDTALTKTSDAFYTKLESQTFPSEPIILDKKISKKSIQRDFDTI